MGLKSFIFYEQSKRNPQSKPHFTIFLRNGSIFMVAMLLKASLWGQSLNYVNFNVQNGLTSNEVFDIFQDAEKNIWIATGQGVVKYDGEEFVHYTTKDGLGDNSVYYIHQDKRGRIWFLPNNGMLSYYYKGKILSYQYNKILKDHILYKGIPRGLFIDEKEDMYIGFLAKGVVKITDSGKLEDLTGTQQKPSRVFGLYHQSGAYLPYIVSPQIRNKKSYLAFNCGTKDSLYSITSGGGMQNIFFVQRKNGDFLISISSILYLVRDCQILNKFVYSNEIISMYEDRDSNIWIGCKATGVKKFKTVHHFEENEAVECYFNNLSITKTLQDHSGNYWFTSLENGVFYIPNMHIKTMIDVTKVISGFYISKIRAINGKLYVGTNNGEIYSYVNNKLVEYRVPGNTKIGYVLTIEQLKDGFFISGSGNSIFIQKKEVHHNTMPIHTITNDGKGNTYFCASRSINRISGNGDTTIIQNRKTVKFASIFCDSRGTIWLGGYDGLYCIKDDTLCQINLPFISSFSITQIVENKNRLYLSTTGHGIIILSATSMECINVDKGLPSDMVNSILVQDKKTLWAATTGGVCKINLDDHSVEMVINEKKGLPSSEVRMLAMINDTLFMASNNYLSFFNIHSVTSTPFSPEIFIKEVKVNNHSLKSLVSNSFEYTENNIEFKVHSYLYNQLGNIEYKYRLRGLSDEFSYTTNNTIRFNFLPAGKYTFEVYALNEDNMYSDKPAIFNFIITKAYWKTGWFYVAVSVGIMLLIISLVYIYFKRLAVRKDTQLQLLESKQQAFANQMNPHFIFNALNSIQTYILAENKNKAIDYLSKFSKLMRLTLQNTREALVSMKEEIELLTHYLELEKTRYTKMDYIIEVDKTVLATQIHIPTMLIQPFVENSLKHGILKKNDKDGMIRISFHKISGFLYCSVEDNGVGINHSKSEIAPQEHISAAMEITQSRLKMLCQVHKTQYEFEIRDKSDQNANETGTIVKFIIPYKTVENV